MSARTYWDEPRAAVFQCSECSEKVNDPAELSFDSRCSCSADLHCCRNCSYFDPSAENECRQTIETRIAKKRKNNECPSFKPSLVVDLMGSGKGVDAGAKAKQAFDDLFDI